MNHEMLAQELIPYAEYLGAALAQDTSGLLAKKVVETAGYVTGIYGSEAAVAAVKNDPTAQERFRKAMQFLLRIEQRALAAETPAAAIAGEKDLLQSKTTWGVLVPIITMLVTHYGFDLGDQQGWVDAISGLIGALLVFWGRVKAIKRVTSIAGVKVT
jgi:hypothetical protein